MVLGVYTQPMLDVQKLSESGIISSDVAFCNTTMVHVVGFEEHN